MFFSPYSRPSRRSQFRPPTPPTPGPSTSPTLGPSPKAPSPPSATRTTRRRSASPASTRTSASAATSTASACTSSGSRPTARAGPSGTRPSAGATTPPPCRGARTVRGKLGTCTYHIIRDSRTLGFFFFVGSSLIRRMVLFQSAPRSASPRKSRSPLALTTPSPAPRRPTVRSPPTLSASRPPTRASPSPAPRLRPPPSPGLPTLRWRGGRQNTTTRLRLVKIILFIFN